MRRSSKYVNYFAVGVLIFVLQIVLYTLAEYISIRLRSDCQFLKDDPFMTWQCTGNANPLIPSYFAALIFPPVLVKLGAIAFHKNLQLLRIIAIEIGVIAAAAIVFIIYGTLTFHAAA